MSYILIDTGYSVDETGKGLFPGFSPQGRGKERKHGQAVAAGG